MRKKPETIPKYHPNLPDYGVLIESHHHEPNFKTGMHMHSYSTLIYVVSGRGKCIAADRSFQLEPDTVLFLDKGVAHQMTDKPGGAMVVFVVYFSSEVPIVDQEALEPLVKNPLVHVRQHNSRYLRQLLRQMLHEQKAKPPLYQSSLCQCLASIVLSLHRMALSGAEKRDNLSTQSKVLEVLDYVSSHYYESFTLSDAAADVGISARQFANVCRQLKGQSFVQYLNEIRINRAVELLVNTPMSISAVAFEVGFEELSTFYRAFKKHKSQTPMSFRKTVIKNEKE